MAVVVDGRRENARIAELNQINNQLRWWRWGTVAISTLFLIWCVWVLYDSVHGLTAPGVKQDEFVQTFNQSLQSDTVPTLEHEASATITEMQPVIKDSVLKLRDNVPQLAQSAEDQIRILQTELPQKGQAILNKHFANIVQSKEETIRKLYPNVTDDQVKALVTNITQHAQTQMTEANNELFGPHQQKLNSILASMDKIRSDEAVSVKDEQPDWDMGVLLLDLFRDDLKGMADGQKSGKSSDDAAKTVAENSTVGGRA